MLPLLFLFVAYTTAAPLFDNIKSGTQSIAVKGTLYCGSEPAANVRVKLWDEDDGPDPDDLLDQGYSDSNGSFMLQGTTIEMTPIDPMLKIYHNCNDEILPGHRKVKFELPNKYISSGPRATMVMDAGLIQLELEFKDEGRTMLLD